MKTAAIMAAKPTAYGMRAFGLLLAAYFGVLTLISGRQFTLSQFYEFWHYIVPRAARFGLQVALYMSLRQSNCRSRARATPSRAHSAGS